MPKNNLRFPSLISTVIGNDPYPQRYNWSAGPDCGFPGGKDALFGNNRFAQGDCEKIDSRFLDDINAVQEKIHVAGLPEHLALRLA